MSVPGCVLLARGLRRLGVKRVFTLPGLHLLQTIDTLVEGGLQVVLASDERGAVHMADAQFRSGGGLAAVLVVPGPGATNAVTGLAEALLDQAAVLLIAPSSATTPKRHGRMHAIDQERLWVPVSKALYVVEVPHRLAEAVACATRAPAGPVVLAATPEALEGVAEDTPTAASSAHEPRDLAGLSAIVDDLLANGPVGICAGAGAFAAPAALRAVAEHLAAPVATTISGRGTLPEDHPLALGPGPGPFAAAWTRRATARVRTWLALGCRFSEAATAGWAWTPTGRLLHIDADPAVPGANFLTDRKLIADLAWALPELLRLLRERSAPAPPGDPGLRLAEQRHVARIIGRTARRGVTPARLLRSLRQELPRDACITGDSGNHLLWALQELPVLEPRSFICPADFQAMGFAVPAAVGVALAHPGRQVVALIGDGGLLLGGMELASVLRLGLALRIVVFADGALGLIRAAQDASCRQRAASTLAMPDLAMLAAAFGCAYVRISTDDEISSGLRRALATPGAVLIEARVVYRGATRYARAAALHAWRGQPVGVRMRQAGRLLLNRLRPPPDAGG